MKAALYNKRGNKKGEVVLNPEIYAARVNHRLLELVHKAYAANRRHGTADTKVRHEVRGGGRKPWRQKGTGRARAGSIRSPIWVGGGTVFGPHPRDYTVHLPKTIRNRALISALSLRGDEKNVILVEDVKLESAKTKEWVELIKSLPLGGKRTLCVVKNYGENLKRAARNVANLVQVRTAKEFNAYDVLQRPKVVIEQDAVPEIETRLLGTTSPEAPEGEKREVWKPKKKTAGKKSFRKSATKAKKETSR